MKKHLLVLPVMMATMLCAQGPRGFGRAAASTTPPTPAQIAQRDVNRLTRFLNLTGSQPATVLGILTTAITNLQADAPTLQGYRATLVAAVKANDQTGKIESTLLLMSPLQEHQEGIRYNAAKAIYAQLTPTQQALVTNVMILVGGGGAGFGGMRPVAPASSGSTTTP